MKSFIHFLPALAVIALSVHPSAFAQQSSVRMAPPPPEVTAEAYAKELQRRREAVASRIGPTSAMVLHSARLKVFSNDTDYEFRQESNFFYLTGLRQPDAALLLLPDHPATPEILFLPRRDPALETWNGDMYSADQAYELSGIDEIWDRTALEPFLEALKAGRAYRPEAEKVFRTNAGDSAEAATPERLFEAADSNAASLYVIIPSNRTDAYEREQELAAEWVRTRSGYVIRDASVPLFEQRLIKSPLELRFMRQAIAITEEALVRAMKALPKAAWEYEIEAEIEATFRRRNAPTWAFPSIVASGSNATTLHYRDSKDPIEPNELVLMDVGAEYGVYAADITRTVPSRGKFTTDQAAIYQLVLDAQEAAAASIGPGSTLRTVHRAGVERLEQGLLELGLITETGSDQYRRYFMHGVSHYLGLDVHDPGDRDAPLEPGMVFTIEPGLYIREDALDYLPDTPENRAFIEAVRPVQRRYAGIGVRIEDDILISDEIKPIWLSTGAPRTIAEIERTMRP